MSNTPLPPSEDSPNNLSAFDDFINNQLDLSGLNNKPTLPKPPQSSFRGAFGVHPERDKDDDHIFFGTDSANPQEEDPEDFDLPDENSKPPSLMRRLEQRHNHYPNSPFGSEPNTHEEEPIVSGGSGLILTSSRGNWAFNRHLRAQSPFRSSSTPWKTGFISFDTVLWVYQRPGLPNAQRFITRFQLGWNHQVRYVENIEPGWTAVEFPRLKITGYIHSDQANFSNSRLSHLFFPLLREWDNLFIVLITIAMTVLIYLALSSNKSINVETPAVQWEATITAQQARISELETLLASSTEK